MYSVIIIGTGFGGLSAAINLRKLGIDDFIMLERREFAGGTWLQNTYPGAAVDVQSPLYSLSGHPYPWSHLFAKQNEIAHYTNGIISQYSLIEKILTNATVEKAVWDNEHWKISLKTGERYACKILINATGPLSTPVVPKFAGLAIFQGKHFHSNDWQHEVDLNGKTVAIVGSGASAVQIIPAIIDKVKCLHVLQRTPHWIIPRLDWEIPVFLRKFLALLPIYTFIRWCIYWALELRVIGFKYSKKILSLVAQRPAIKHLKKQVKDPKLREILKPNFIIGCKRILISNTFYPALQRNNCVVHDASDNITCFTKKGIKFAKEGEVDVDIVIFATGYDAVDSMVSYQVTGKNGTKLSNSWTDYPRAYLGTSIPHFPNFYVVTGPNTGIGHTSAIFVIESQMKYIMQCIEKIALGSVKTIEPTEYAEQQYTDMVHSEMTKTVWSYGDALAGIRINKAK